MRAPAGAQRAGVAGGSTGGRARLKLRPTRLSEPGFCNGCPNWTSTAPRSWLRRAAAGTGAESAPTGLGESALLGAAGAGPRRSSTPCCTVTNTRRRPTFRIGPGLRRWSGVRRADRANQARRHQRGTAQSTGRGRAPRYCWPPWTASPTGSLQPRPQPTDGVSLAPRLSPRGRPIALRPARHRGGPSGRACTPEPGAWASFRGERISSARLPRPISASRPAPCGWAAGRCWSGTATSAVQLSTCSRPGNAAMPRSDRARGARLADTDHLD